MARRGYSPGRSYKARFEQQEGQEEEYRSRQADAAKVRKAQYIDKGVDYAAGQLASQRERNITSSVQKKGSFSAGEFGVEEGTNLYTDTRQTGAKGIGGKTKQFLSNLPKNVSGNWMEANPEVLNTMVQDQVGKSDLDGGIDKNLTDIYGEKFDTEGFQTKVGDERAGGTMEEMMLGAKYSLANAQGSSPSIQDQVGLSDADWAKRQEIIAAGVNNETFTVSGVDPNKTAGGLKGLTTGDVNLLDQDLNPNSTIAGKDQFGNVTSGIKTTAPNFLEGYTPNLNELGSSITAADDAETLNIQEGQLAEIDSEIGAGVYTDYDVQEDRSLGQTLGDNFKGLFSGKANPNAKEDWYTARHEKMMAGKDASYGGDKTAADKLEYGNTQFGNEYEKEVLIDRATKREEAQFTEAVDKDTADLANADMAEVLAMQKTTGETDVIQTAKEDHDVNMQSMILDQEAGAKTYSDDKAAQYRDRMDIINRKEGVGKYSDPKKKVATDFFRGNEVGSTDVNTIEEAYELTGNNAEKIATTDGVDVNETAKNIQKNTSDALLDKSNEDLPDVKSDRINALDAYNVGRNVETIVSGDSSEEDKIAAGKGLASKTTSTIAKKEVQKKVTEETKKIAAQKLEEEAEKKAIETMTKQATTTGGTTLGTAATAGGGVLAGVTGFATAKAGAEGFSDAKERGEVDEMISQGVTATGGAVAGTGGVMTAIGGALTLTGVGAVVGAPMMAIGGAMTTYGGIAATAGSMYTMADNVIESRKSGGKSGGSSNKRTKSRDRGSNYGRA